MTNAISSENVWAGVRHLGMLFGMPKRPVDPESVEQVARRLRALKKSVYEGSDAGFARSLGMSPQAWSNYVQNPPVARISPNVAYKLCSATGVTFDFIYRGIISGVPFDLAQKLQAALKDED